MKFTDNIVRYEALTNTPLKDVFGAVPCDGQLRLVECVVSDFHTFLGNRVASRKLWQAYARQTDFTELGKSAIYNETFSGKVKKSLDKLANLW